MIRRIDLRGQSGVDYRDAVPRADFDIEAAVPAVHRILEAVRTRGVEAILELNSQFDGGTADDELRVSASALADALAGVDPDVLAGLQESIRRLRATCAAELERDAVTTLGPGAVVTHRKVPVGRVGLYVPGGLAPLVSSVLMNVVPAQVAGVTSIALASPPQKDHGGLPHPTILAACALLGVEEVYSVGGAQAIGMFAYGAGPCARVDLVTGPGNIYVVTAKRLVKGQVGIDSEAGPTEIAVLADDTADAAFVAADLVSQAEHDPLAASVLVTPSVALADAVEIELERQVLATKHRERIQTSLSGSQSAIVLVDDLDQGLAVVDAYAAEHLEVQTADAAAVAARVRNAGAVFVGPHAPVSLGDYCAGSNHVLPSGGCACHSSGLSVRAFTRSMHVVDYSRAALAEVADHVVTLAEAEDLPGHGAAVRVRFERQAGGVSFPPLREELRGIEPYGAPQLSLEQAPVQLNVNENPYGPSPACVADIATAVAVAAVGLNRYPDREFLRLRTALAAYLSRDTTEPIRPEQVWAANGSNEVMLQLLQAFGGPGRTALSFAPTYSMYPEYARDTSTRWVAGRRAEDFTLDVRAARGLIAAERPSVVLLPSPNNPTGTALTPADVAALAEAVGDEGLLVVDEAYGEFRRDGTPSALELLPDHRNLVVTRTMSKAFAAAGLRLGYLAAAPEVTDAIRVVRLPYHLSAVTQAVALAALRHAPELLGAVAELRAERDATVAWLRAQGHRVAESDANFVLFGTFPDRHAVWQGLLDRGVLIRETGPEGWLRVSVGTAAEMAAFRDALTRVTTAQRAERAETAQRAQTEQGELA